MFGSCHLYDYFITIFSKIKCLSFIFLVQTDKALESLSYISLFLKRKRTSCLYYTMNFIRMHQQRSFFSLIQSLTYPIKLLTFVIITKKSYFGLFLTSSQRKKFYTQVVAKLNSYYISDLYFIFFKYKLIWSKSRSNYFLYICSTLCCLKKPFGFSMNKGPCFNELTLGMVSLNFSSHQPASRWEGLIWHKKQLIQQRKGFQRIDGPNITIPQMEGLSGSNRGWCRHGPLLVS